MVLWHRWVEGTEEVIKFFHLSSKVHLREKTALHDTTWYNNLWDFFPFCLFNCLHMKTGRGRFEVTCLHWSIHLRTVKHEDKVLQVPDRRLPGQIRSLMSKEPSWVQRESHIDQFGPGGIKAFRQCDMSISRHISHVYLARLNASSTSCHRFITGILWTTRATWTEMNSQREPGTCGASGLESTCSFQQTTGTNLF